ncbi:hypothetical protein EMIT0P228_80024 [Pseudomonas brassicacearum]
MRPNQYAYPAYPKREPMWFTPALFSLQKLRPHEAPFERGDSLVYRGPTSPNLNHQILFNGEVHE